MKNIAFMYYQAYFVLKGFQVMLFSLLFLSDYGSHENTQKQNSLEKEIIIQNPLDIDRKSETVSIALADLRDLTKKYSPEDLLIKDAEGNGLVTQLVDNDQDGSVDEILFQINIKAGEKKNYKIIGQENGSSLQPKSKLTTYSRFVPERTDDYTWENDKVAFRTFGPEAQRRIEENEPGGTLSSGIDLWLKKVSYSIIDDWYKKNLDVTGYYHTDHGEGYDPYHVGKSRGTGGSGIWMGDSLHISKNFAEYKTIATGPIRTLFELSYAPWSEFNLQEKKRISLDLGSNFSKFEINLDAEKTIPNYTLGITLHEGKGQTKINTEKGWVRHWEEIDGAFLGEGIILASKEIDSAFVHISSIRDQSQLFVLTQPRENKLIYYAGFAWTKSGQVKSVEDWDRILEEQAKKINNPLKIIIK